MKKCPFCADDLRDDAKKCARCGGLLPTQEPSPVACKICGRTAATQLVFFKENISYFVGRSERTFCGYACFGCVTKTFAAFELRTLLGTWWGVIGVLVGPPYLVSNIAEYAKSGWRFARRRAVRTQGLMP